MRSVSRSSWDKKVLIYPPYLDVSSWRETVCYRDEEAREHHHGGDVDSDRGVEVVWSKVYSGLVDDIDDHGWHVNC